VTLSGRPGRLYFFNFGWETMEEAISQPGGSWDRFILEPITGAAVVFDDGWVLVDTGSNPEIVRDLALRNEHYTRAHLPSLPQGDPLLRQLEAARLDLDDLAFCAMSHLHCDHSGGLRHLVNGPPIFIQKREHEYAFGPAGLNEAYFRTDYAREGLDWQRIEGEQELAPGFRSLPTFGHTPGHQSFVVELPTQTIVLACDAADLKSNIDEVVAPGFQPTPELGRHAQQSIELLHRLDKTEGTEVWPGHDPLFWESRLHPPAAYS
jgi:N-acyl homoserine lactone hydrolase